MKKEVVSLFCVFALLGGTTAAFAGAYGEKEQPEELPASPPPAPAMAAPVEDFAAAGPYVQLGGVYAIENFDNLVSEWTIYQGADPLERVDTKVDNSWGYQIRAGYRINRFVAVEAEWEHDVDFNGQIKGKDSGDVYSKGSGSAYALTANGKFYPITGCIQPYALVGAGWVNAQNNLHTTESCVDCDLNQDRDAFGFRFGLGVETYVTRNIGFAAEAGYVLPVTGALSDYGVDTIPVSLSAFYRFN